MLTVSYLKLLGRIYWSRALSTENLPRALIIDSHLHDLFEATTFGDLPLTFRLAYARNRRKGLEMLAWVIERLRELGYTFLTVGDLYHKVAEA